jgi:COP9 signalosome complex subunit 7
LTLLEIFSYGTYATYQKTASRAGLPALNEQQTLKLRQLSLLTIAREPAHLSYATLQTQLGLPDARTLEDLVISATYAGLLDAQLDPHNQAVRVSSVSPLRDLAPGSVPSLLSNLESWSSRCTSTLEDLEAQISAIKATASQRHAEKKAWDATTERLLEEEKNTASNKGHDSGGVHGPNQRNVLNRAIARLGGSGSSRYGKRGMDPEVEDDEAMDVDDEEIEESVEGKKRASRRKL